MKPKRGFSLPNGEALACNSRTSTDVVGPWAGIERLTLLYSQETSDNCNGRHPTLTSPLRLSHQDVVVREQNDLGHLSQRLHFWNIRRDLLCQRAGVCLSASPRDAQAAARRGTTTHRSDTWPCNKTSSFATSTCAGLQLPTRARP